MSSIPSVPIGIVVLNFNAVSETIRCVESLLSAVPSPERIVIVDNGSTDGSASAFVAAFGNSHLIEVVRLPANLGYAGGMNRGIQHLLPTGIKIVLLLNNDTLVEKGFLGPLVESLKEGSGFHIATPRILYSDGATIWSTGERIFYPLLFGVRNKGHPDGPRFLRAQRINGVTGCAMAVRREVFEYIGLFDEKYFAYVEEMDFCWRALRAGFRLTYSPHSVVLHREATVLEYFSPAQIYLKARNRIYFIRKNVPLVFRPLSYTWHFMVMTAWTIQALFLGKEGITKSISLGLFDAIKGRMGAPDFAQPKGRENA